MKKICLCSIIFFNVFNASAQDFAFQWVNDMSLYLGGRIRDIPDIYEQEEDDTAAYSRKISEEITEWFVIKDNIIMGAAWGKVVDRRSFLYSEYDRYVNLVKTQIGEPLVEDDDNAIWNWNSKALVVTVDNKIVGIGLCLPEAMNITQAQWEERVRELSGN